MKQLRLFINYCRRASLWLFALFAGSLLLGPVQNTMAGPSALYLPITQRPLRPGRHVYLTNQSFSTDQVKTACASGYHTASLWEILDVSNVIYDRAHPAAFKAADHGFGFPTDRHGWIRTGNGADSSSVTGSGNCKNWTSVSAADYGVSVRLSRYWETAPSGIQAGGEIGAWDANSFTCNYTGPVWCARWVTEIP